MRHGFFLLLLTMNYLWNRTRILLIFLLQALQSTDVTGFSVATATPSSGRHSTPTLSPNHHRVCSRCRTTRVFISLGADEDDEQIIAATTASDKKQNNDTRERDQQWQERADQTILLVDDDEDLRQSVETFLNEQGFQVTACGSAEAALQWLEERTAKNLLPNLIISDIRMPGGMDGFELAAQARRIRPDLPIIYMSGYTGFSQAQMGAVPAPILAKPMHFRCFPPLQK